MLNHKGTRTIETKRLVLRQFSPADAESMFANWANDPEVTEFLTWAPHGCAENTRSLLETWEKAYENPGCYNWAICKCENEEPAGSISVVKLDENAESCEIGYCISKSLWGNGYMTESLKAVIRFLFAEVGMNRIEARHDTNNPASGKVMQNNGMTFEGVLREAGYCEKRGFYDLAVYGLLNREYKDEEL